MIIAMMKYFILFSTSFAFTNASWPPQHRSETFHACLDKANVVSHFSESPSFTSLSLAYNLRLSYVPLAITIPTTPYQVSSTIRCANTFRHKITARGGGHSYAAFGLGGENGHVIVDLQQMNNITYDVNTTHVTVGAGARLGNVADLLDKQGRAMPMGTCPTVGIAGHALHGGFGAGSRMWGLALDQIISVNVVLANGTILDNVSSQNHPDLFWGLTGAGPNFGIVTQFTFKTFPSPAQNTYFLYRWSNMTAQTAAKAFLTIQDWASKNAPPEMFIRLELLHNTGTDFKLSGTLHNQTTTTPFHKLFNPLLSRLSLTPSQATVRQVTWRENLLIYASQKTLIVPTTNLTEHGTFYAKSLVIDESSPLQLEQLTSFFTYANTNGTASASSGDPWFVQFALYGGPKSAINSPQLLFKHSYAHRSALWTVQFKTNIIGTVTPATNQRAIDFTNGFVKTLQRMNDTMYVNYVDPTLSREDSYGLYYDVVADRLKGLKMRYDPRRVFDWPQSF